MLGKVLAATSVIKIPMQRSDYDVSHDYYQKLLVMALTEAADGRAIPSIQIGMAMSQGRAAQELIKGDAIDVYWLGTDNAIEQQLRAIRIPTTRGLIGYRRFIIRKESVDAFDNINSMADLSKFIACQGTHWPDTKILQAAKLAVTTTPIYENNFKMLVSKRCDYFPRGYHDSDNELLNRKGLYPDLISYHRILLHYPFAVYFFTNKSNEALAQWIERGLEQLADKGLIEQLMKSHPLTAHIYPLKQVDKVLYLDIPNPILPANTVVHDAKYWIQPQDFR